MFGFHKIMSIYCIFLLCSIMRLAQTGAVDSQEIVAGKVNTVCFGSLGCLDFKPNIHAKNENPIQSFTLFTRNNLEEGQILEVNSTETITNSNFLPKAPTKFLIHGYVSETDPEWMMSMKNELLKNSNFNVILVQWPSWTDYFTAKIRITLVGQEVAKLINTLGDLMGLDLNNVHLIGHSLGAHAAGFVGKHLKGLVGRITGLDPAGPLYEGTPPAQRLDHTDAQLVDVIHTCARMLGLGIRMSYGDIDFYPNGGKKQPGCTSNKNIKGQMSDMGCDHMRVLDLFAESINSKCLFVANKCDSYEDFQKGNCFSENVTDLNIMGFKVRKPSSPPGSKYFLITGDAPPYCSLQYKATFNLAKPLGFALYDNDSHSNSTDSGLVISLPFNQGKTTKSYRDNVNKILYQ